MMVAIYQQSCNKPFFLQKKLHLNKLIQFGWKYINSMRTSQLDPYALKNYTFALHHTNNHFSFITIVISLIVLGLSTFFSLSIISHLWIHRSHLPIEAIKSLSYPKPLTQTLVCFKSNSIANNTIPNIKIWSSDLKQLNLPKMSEEEAIKRRPQLVSKMFGHFGCIDLKGFSFEKYQQIYIDVDRQNSSLYLQSISQQGIINNQGSKFIEVKSQKSMSYEIRLKFIEATIRDTLVINQQPQVVNQFYYLQSNDPAIHIIGIKGLPKHTIFKLVLHIPYNLEDYNINNISIKISRYNIAYILGAILSWLSIFALITTLVLSPIMQKSYSLLQAESLFKINEDYHKPSLFKFILASLRQGYFAKQDLYIKLCDKLQKMKDLTLSLKLSKTLKNLFFDESKIDQTDILAYQDNFNSSSQQISFYTKEQRSSQEYFRVEEDVKQQGGASKVIKGILQWMDKGYEDISIIYSRKGIGSIQSICITILFIIGFISFMVIFGLFNNHSLIDRYSIKQQYTSFTYQPRQLVFATNQSAQIYIYLIDGNYQILSNLGLSTDCKQDLSKDQLSALAHYKYTYCVNAEMSLAYSIRPQQTISLYINNINFQVFDISIFHFRSQALPKSVYNPIDLVLNLSPYDPSSNVNYQSKLTLININDLTYSQFNLIGQINSNICPLFGLTMVLDEQQNYINEQGVSIFDFVQNLWSISTICFTLVLVKITRYINTRQRNKILSEEENQFRDNICVISSKINTLMHGKYHKEIGRIKYYIKTSYQKYQ